MELPNGMRMKHGDRRTAAEESPQWPFAAMGWSLGLADGEADAIHDRLMQGLPYRSVESLLAASGLRQHELLAAAQLPASTLSRRKAAAQLDPAESERLFRVAQVFERTLQLFEGDAAGARRWLTEPVRGLGQRRPLELARTQVGRATRPRPDRPPRARSLLVIRAPGGSTRRSGDRLRSAAKARDFTAAAGTAPVARWYTPPSMPLLPPSKSSSMAFPSNCSPRPIA